MQGQDKPPPTDASFVLLSTSLDRMTASWHDIGFLLPSQSEGVIKVIGKQIHFIKGKIIRASDA